MNDPFQLADVLGQYVQRLAYTPGQLARLSGVPQATIVNWLEGRVKRPRRWHDLLKLAAVLHLNESEAAHLLQAAGHHTIEALITQVKKEEERELLAPWLAANRKRQEAPFQVIADLPFFIGREKELNLLRGALLDEQEINLCALEGMGGVGKTSLAVHLAYLLQSHFLDGVLWANVARSDTMSILSAFALTYGQDISRTADIESRSLVVREMLAGKRALLILDNVEYSEQIRPLLPPTSSCAVIMTTRRRDLSILRGAYRLHLRPFDREQREAFALFTRHLGEARAQEEKRWLEQIADMLGQLPLAIDIVASRLAYEPNWQAADFQRRLKELETRLSELTYEDQSVRSSFAFSYQVLTADLQRLFTALGLFGGEDFSVEAVAAMMNLQVDAAHDLLRQLYGFSLIYKSQPNRYRLHPLLQDYTREQTLNDPDLYHNLVAYFVNFVEVHETDYEILDTEYSNILAALETAVSQEMLSLYIRGVKALFHYLHTKGYYRLADQMLTKAQKAAQTLNLQDERVFFLFCQGKIARSLSEFSLAERHLMTGLQLIDSQDKPRLYCMLSTELGTVKGALGKYHEAETLFQETLKLAYDINDEHQKLTLLTALGICALRQGQYARANMFLLDGLSLARELNHRERIGVFLVNLGVVAFENKRFDASENYYLEALAIQRQIDDRMGICISLSNLSRISLRKAEHQKAVVYLDEGLALAREIGSPEVIHTLLRRFGIAESHRGNYEKALVHFEQSLELTDQLGQWHQSALLLQDLAELSGAIQAYDDARDYFRKSSELARQHSSPIFFCDLLVKWGDFCLNQADLKAARQIYNELANVAKQIDASAGQALEDKARDRLAEIASIRGNIRRTRPKGRGDQSLLKELNIKRQSG